MTLATGAAGVKPLSSYAGIAVFRNHFHREVGQPLWFHKTRASLHEREDFAGTPGTDRFDSNGGSLVDRDVGPEASVRAPRPGPGTSRSSRIDEANVRRGARWLIANCRALP